MWKDCFGRDINVGDIVFYPVKDEGKWGVVTEQLDSYPGNRAWKYLQDCPHIKVKAVQNVKEALLACHRNNLIINLSASPIKNIKDIKK